MNNVTIEWTSSVGELPDELSAVRANLFVGAHDAISDWDSFPWHRDRSGMIQAHKPHSSQALAIDVFGAIKTSPARDAILDDLSLGAGLPPGGPWTVELEWTDDQRLLREPRPTQVDVVAVGAHAILVIECKFTEPGGSCSQTKRSRSGSGVGLPQCTGRYEPQRNPRSGVEGRCALSAKGIGYWDVIPLVFDLDPSASYTPCPFKGDTFQWMRNMVLAHELGRHHGKTAATVIAYASGGGFSTEAKATSSGWLPPLVNGGRSPVMISYREIVELAAEVDDGPGWRDLKNWVERKVAASRR